LIDLRWDICPYCGEEQYPEDVPLQVPAGDEWRAVEHEGVGRFIDQARERLGGHRPRAIPPEAQREKYPPPDWDDRHDDKIEYRQRTESFGTHEAPSDDSWESEGAVESKSQLDNTDELPTPPLRP
jgi:hypothetical protein